MFTRIEVHYQGVDLTTIRTEGSEEDEVKVKTGVIKKIESRYSKFKKINNLFC